jgi:hypothetical protein
MNQTEHLSRKTCRYKEFTHVRTNLPSIKNGVATEIS